MFVHPAIHSTNINCMDVEPNGQNQLANINPNETLYLRFSNLLLNETASKIQLLSNFCHTRPQLTNSTDLNSASADQLGATKWHYNHLPVHPSTHPPVHPPMQNFKIQFKPILTLCQQFYGPGPQSGIIVTYLSTLPPIHPPMQNFKIQFKPIQTKLDLN